ncbi:MAG: LysR family transcriptional regulator [Castellaniella sp.]|nr:LysR family transcriptional regulator [Castellaniella sp.]
MTSNETQTLDIRALRVVMAVAVSGSFTAAAKTLGLTQSAISQVISGIERTVGTRIVDRTKRPLRLTQAGVSLNRNACQIVADMDKLIAQTREAALLSHVEVRLGMIDSFSATVGPYLLKDMVKSTDHIRAWSGLANTHARGLLNRQLDLIISSDPNEDMDGLVRLPLYQEPFLIAVPRELGERFRGLDLNGCVRTLPFIRFSARSHFGGKIERYLRRCAVNIPNFVEIDTADVVLAMIANGLGWAITSPLCVIQGAAHLDRIALLPLPGPALLRMIYLIYREGENEEAADRIFRSSRDAITQYVLPEIKRHMPWMKIPHVT